MSFTVSGYTSHTGAFGADIRADGNRFLLRVRQEHRAPGSDRCYRGVEGRAPARARKAEDETASDLRDGVIGPHDEPRRRARQCPRRGRSRSATRRACRSAAVRCSSSPLCSSLRHRSSLRYRSVPRPTSPCCFSPIRSSAVCAPRHRGPRLRAALHLGCAFRLVRASGPR